MARPRWGQCGASARGASHERRGLPNQDSLEARALGDGCAVVAVADGHGSPHNARSDRGARIAAAIAVDLLSEVVERIGPEGPTAVKRAFEALPVRLCQRWSAEVRRALDAEPLSADELDLVARGEGPAGLRKIEKNPLSIYGSTLLCAAATPELIACLQIGDGDILALGDGRARAIMADDPSLVGNETTSLCSPRAWASFRSCFQRLAGAPPEAILLATDGFSNSFADDLDFHATSTALLRSLQGGGVEGFQRSLPCWLSTASRQASGDDITLALLFRHETQELAP